MDETPLSNFFLSHNRTLYEVNGELINEDGNTSQIIDSDVRLITIGYCYCVL